MKILVFMKEVPDVLIPAEIRADTGRLRKDGEVVQLNSPDRSALETALMIKERLPETHISVIHLGPVSGEKYIREGLALGCDEGLRIWEEGWEEIPPSTKAVIFSRAAQILGYDLLCTGTASQDFGDGQVGQLLSVYLKIPCITSVMNLDIDAKKRNLTAVKRLDWGYQARIASTIPAVVTMEAMPERCLEPSLSARLAACEQVIPCLNLAGLGISWQTIERMNSCLIAGPLRHPRPKLKFTPFPDPALPAFMRIAQLVQGTVKTRAGKIVSGIEAHVVEDLFQVLLKEGWLDHLKKGVV